MKIRDYLVKPQQDKKMKFQYLIYTRKSEESEDRQVQSIDDQIKILTDIALQKNLQIFQIFSESKSAKQPGREQFNKLVGIIDNNPLIKGILVWKLNRLFRNPEDEGKIRQRLSDGRIEEIIIPNKTYYEADSDFIMAVEGAQAQRFIRDLRQDTIRGLMSKIDKGISPTLAPSGYYNDKTLNQGERDIKPHPTYFPLMRKIFELAMTGNYSIMQLYRQAKKLNIRNSRGNNISISRFSELLRSPFYTGNFLYKGKIYPGKHQAMITEDEFDLVQEKLLGKAIRKKIKHQYITGLIKCGNCNRGLITAESHTKKSGKVFTYYRCSKKHGASSCNQKYIKEEEFERQLYQIFGTVRISPKFMEWAIKQVNKENDKESQLHKLKLKTAQQALTDTSIKLENLFKLKLSALNKDNSVLTDEEFRDNKREILLEQKRAEENIVDVLNQQNKWGDLAVETFNFARKAQERFDKGTMPEKLYLVRVLSGSNLYLKNGILGGNLRKPFETIRKAIKAKKERFEPKKDYIKSINMPSSYLPCPVLGG